MDNIEFQVRTLFDTCNKRILSQKIKSKQNRKLWEWVLDQTSEIDDVCTTQERIFLALNPGQSVFCDKGSRKKYVPNKGLSFCGNLKHCECFKEEQTEKIKHSTPFKTNRFLEKRKKTWLEKYGVDNPSKIKDIRQKAKDTLGKRKEETPERYKDRHLSIRRQGFDQVIDRVSDSVVPQFNFEDYSGCFRKNHYQWKCLECGNEFEDHVDYGRLPRCRQCWPDAVSAGELEIREFLDSLNIEYETNVRNIISKELDIYIPSKKIAIEFNGMYWHSSIHKSPDYHIRKYLECKEKGIHLLSIFEDQWQNQKSIVTERLKSKLGKSKRYFARKCQAVQLKSSESKQFIEQHHIQGWCSASIHYGLMYQSEIVAVMTFGPTRFQSKNKNTYELMRYCSAGTVVGGASKLLTHFVKFHRPEKIISYADRCWSNGELYRTLGFKDVTEYDQNTGYFYFKNNKRYHRSSFTKNQLVELGFDSNMTETEIMLQNGFLKIHNCGNYKFELDIKLKT